MRREPGLPEVVAGSAPVIELADPAADRRWGEFLDSTPGAYLCHHPGWRRVIEGSFRHIRGYYPVMIDDGRIVAALPLFHVQSWLTGDRLVSMPFATLCDPLSGPGVDWSPLLDYATGLARKLNVRRIELKSYAAPPPDSRTGFRAVRDFRLHVLVPDDDDIMLKRFDRTCVVQKIHRAQKSGVLVRRAESAADLRRFYDLYAMTRKRVGVPPQPAIFFEKLWEVFSGDGMVTILLASHSGADVAGLMLYSFGRRVSAEYLGYDERSLQVNPHHLLFWEAIRSARRAGCIHFDFGRTSVRNSGLMKFKGHWGTEARELPLWISPGAAAERSTPQDTTVTYRMIQQFCRRAPQFAVNALGRFAYRHLG